MSEKKVKLLAMLVVALCANGVTYTAHAEEIKDTNTSTPVVSTVEVNNENGIGSEESKVNKAMAAKESDVEITNNWLTEEVAKQLNKMIRDLTVEDFKQITKIDLHYTKIDDKIPEEISLMTNLQYLNLNYTRLSGDIPESISTLTKLTYLDLGDNKLEGISDSLLKNIKNGKYTYCDVLGNQFKLYGDWYYLKGKWCYFDKWGYQAKGSQTIEGKEYEFTEDGYVREGWEKNDDGTSCYYDKEKGLVKDSWLAIGSSWYYFDDNGEMQTGMQTINGKKYYLGTDGIMVTGIQTIEGKQYLFASSGEMVLGWADFNGKKYYTDPQTGELTVNQTKVINGMTYKFLSDGTMLSNGWIDGNTYMDANGQMVSRSNCHSNTQFQLFKYMTDTNNRVSVHYRAIELHGGVTSNNCVFFTSEALRRVGIDLPLGTCNTYDLEDKLQAMGFVESYDLSQLKPGDIVFTNGYTHVYIFMGWSTNGYAYICDNQADSFDNKVLHLRNIYGDTATTDRATHFFYYPY